MCLTLGMLSQMICEVATTSGAVSSVLLAGSSGIKADSDVVSHDSDIDLVVFLRPNCQADSVMQGFVSLGLTHKVLIHPLIIPYEEIQMKGSIPEYRNMFRSARSLFKTDDITDQQIQCWLRECKEK